MSDPHSTLKALSEWNPKTQVITADLTVEQRPNLLDWIVTLITGGFEGVRQRKEQTDAAKVAEKVSQFVETNSSLLQLHTNAAQQLGKNLAVYGGAAYNRAALQLGFKPPVSKLARDKKKYAQQLVLAGLTRRDVAAIQRDRDGKPAKVYKSLVKHAGEHRSDSKGAEVLVHPQNRAYVSHLMDLFGGLAVQEEIYLHGAFKQPVEGLDAQDVSARLSNRYLELFGKPADTSSAANATALPYVRNGECLIIGPTLAEKVREFAETDLATNWLDDSLDFHNKTASKRLNYTFHGLPDSYGIGRVADGIVNFVQDNSFELRLHHDELQRFALNLIALGERKPQLKRALSPAINILSHPALNPDRLAAIEAVERQDQSRS